MGLDITQENLANAGASATVDAAVPATGMPEVPAAPIDPNASSATSLTQDLESAGDYPAVLPEAKPLTGMEAIGTPGMPEIIKTAEARAAEVATNKAEENIKKPSFWNKFNKINPFSTSVTKLDGTPITSATPDHLTTNANGALETPPVTNLNGATADGPAVTKEFGDTSNNNYAGLSTPDAMAAGAAIGVPFQNSIPQPEVPTEIVAGNAPSLGSATPIVEADTLSTTGEAVSELPAAEVVAAPAAVADEPEAPAEFQPSADAAPADEVGALPPAPTAENDMEVADAIQPAVPEPTAEEPAAEEVTEEALPVGLSADANTNQVDAGPGAGANGVAAPTDWSVNADIHPDASKLPNLDPTTNNEEAVTPEEKLPTNDVLGEAIADGAAAAAERPPFSAEALNQPAEGTVGHDLAIETIAQAPLNSATEAETPVEVIGGIADTPSAAIVDRAVEPAAPAVVVPVTPMSSGVGMVDNESTLATGMPEPLSTTAQNDILNAAEKGFNNSPLPEPAAPLGSAVDQAVDVVTQTGFGAQPPTASTTESSIATPEPTLAGVSSVNGADGTS